MARKKDGTFDQQVKNDHAAAKKTEKEPQGQTTSFRKEPTASQESQKQNGLPRVSGSRSLHNLSYHQAVDSAAQSGISTGGCTVAKASLPSVALNGGHNISNKRSQVSHPLHSTTVLVS